MSKSNHRRICILLFVFVTLTGLLYANVSAASAGADTVRITALVAQQFGISVFKSDGVPLRATVEHQMRNKNGALKKTFPASKAHLPKDIVEKAAPVIWGHKEPQKFIVGVAATDGCSVAFSYGDLIYGPAGANVWLMPVSSNAELRGDGPFVLFSKGGRGFHSSIYEKGEVN